MCILCRICKSYSSCADVNPMEAARAVEAMMKNDGSDVTRNCLCDERCRTYGDCCIDSMHFNSTEQKRAATTYRCVKTNGYNGAYVVAKCPAALKDKRVRDACEKPDSVDRDGMLSNPVTSRTTGLVYMNRFCAACNGDMVDPIIWDTKLVCEDLFDVENRSEQAAVVDTLRYNAGMWTVDFQGKPYECNPVVVPPVNTYVRPCQPNIVTMCSAKWHKGNIQSACEEYTTVMYYDGLAYKNVHCAMCNQIPVQNIQCEDGKLHPRNPNQFGLRSFTALFVAQPGQRKCSSADSFYDPFIKKCQSLSPVINGLPFNCTTIAMYSIVPSDWQPSTAYVTLDNGTTAVCMDGTSSDTTESPSEALKSTALTYVGLGVSVVFLIIHLAVFTALPEMKNLSGKNLASFCVSLVCSYAAFVVSNWLTGPACYVGAAFTYYSFLTSFAWMLIMSFDCWRTLRLATVELRVTTGRQTKKFLVYSAVCWLMPAMMTLAAVATDSVPAVPDDIRPKFGVDQCWFGSKTALLVFFAGPLSAVMTINFLLFVWTAYMIHSSRATVRHVNTRHVRRDFRMYCRMAVLMGLTWTTGILASYTDSKYLWILFVVLNTFQGLFVFVAFTCRRRILNSLVSGGDHHVRSVHSVDPEKTYNGKNRVTPASFSWSSSENSAPVSSEKTSDTLY